MRYPLKVNLLEANASQRDLAKFVGVTDSTVCRWALHNVKPTPKQQALIDLFLRQAREREESEQERARVVQQVGAVTA